MTDTYADLSFTTRPDPESELTLWSVSPTGTYARDCHKVAWLRILEAVKNCRTRSR